jgi:hypothetical protein
MVTPGLFANPQVVAKDGEDCLGATTVRSPVAAAVGV